jgi:ribosomal protein S18 acetylase RimI-like enzyme
MTDSGTPPAIALRRAGLEDLDVLAPLFDAYRQFYGLPADRALSREYLRARLSRGESVILLADASAHASAHASTHAAAGRSTGFCQLYPTWCSLAAAPIYVLYDLFVSDAARRGGIGRALLKAAAAHARQAGAARMDLSTARTNAPAQALYESLGWRRDEVFLTYSLDLA